MTLHVVKRDTTQPNRPEVVGSVASGPAINPVGLIVGSGLGLGLWIVGILAIRWIANRLEG